MYVQQSVEGKIAKKRKYQEERTVENRSEHQATDFPADPNANVTKEKAKEQETLAGSNKPVQVKARRKQKTAVEESAEVKFASDEYKIFLEEKAKSAFESLFGNLRMVLDGTTEPLETHGVGGGSASETDIREGFSRLRSAIRSIPSSIEDDFRKEFEEKHAKSEKVKVSNHLPELSSKNETDLRPVLSGEKVPIEIDPRLKDGRKKETILKPISSEQSNHSVGEKTVTTYFCPVSKSCKFTLTKVIKFFLSKSVPISSFFQAEMREMVKARIHLTDDHHIKLW